MTKNSSLWVNLLQEMGQKWRIFTISSQVIFVCLESITGEISCLQKGFFSEEWTVEKIFLCGLIIGQVIAHSTKVYVIQFTQLIFSPQLQISLDKTEWDHHSLCTDIFTSSKAFTCGRLLPLNNNVNDKHVSQGATSLFASKQLHEIISENDNSDFPNSAKHWF